MSERKSKPVTKNTIPNRPRLGLRGLGQVQVFAHNSLRTLTQQSSQKGITETENSQSLLRNQGSTDQSLEILEISARTDKILKTRTISAVRGTLCKIRKHICRCCRYLL